MKSQLQNNILSYATTRKLVLLCAILNLSIASAQTFAANGVNYVVIGSTTNVQVGANTNYAGALIIPSTVVYNAITYSVTSIKKEAFYKCKSITSVTIPDSVISMGASAFMECTSLTSATIGNSVTSIGADAFYSCTGLTSLTIGNSVKTIGNYAFRFCTSLVAVTIPNSVIAIKRQAFDNCTSLTSLTIGNSVASIGLQAFGYCKSLTSVSIPDSVTSIESQAFLGCSGLTSIIIPNSVTSIGVSTFNGCRGLTSVTIPNSVTSIESQAFAGCSGLTSVIIPNSVTTIGTFVFHNCKGLTSVTIPNSVISIGEYAFFGCNNLATVNCAVVTPLVINANVFGYVNQPMCALNVPAASVNAYKSANIWKDFGPITTLSSESFTSNNKIKIYPNPVSNTLTIQNPLSGSFQLKVINNLGQLVLKQNQNTTSTSLDVSMLSKGLYFLNIDSDDGKAQTIKFIKN